MDTHNQFQTFCRNVRFLRTSNHLSQEEMARRLHISIYCLRKIEADTIPPSLDIEVLFHIQRVFNIPPSKLLSEDLQERF